MRIHSLFIHRFAAIDVYNPSKLVYFISPYYQWLVGSHLSGLTTAMNLPCHHDLFDSWSWFDSFTHLSVGTYQGVYSTEKGGNLSSFVFSCMWHWLWLPRGHRLGIDGTGGTTAVRLRSANLDPVPLPEQKIIDLIGLFGPKPRPPATL
jgi:hypothetical protein